MNRHCLICVQCIESDSLLIKIARYNQTFNSEVEVAQHMRQAHPNMAVLIAVTMGFETLEPGEKIAVLHALVGLP